MSKLFFFTFCQEALRARKVIKSDTEISAKALVVLADSRVHNSGTKVQAMIYEPPKLLRQY